MGPGTGRHGGGNQGRFVHAVFQAGTHHFRVLFDATADPGPETLHQFVVAPVHRVRRRQAVLVNVVPVGQPFHVRRTVDDAVVIPVEPLVRTGELLQYGPPGPESAPGPAQGVAVSIPVTVRDPLEQCAPPGPGRSGFQAVLVQPLLAIEHGPRRQFQRQPVYPAVLDGHAALAPEQARPREGIAMGPRRVPGRQFLYGAHGPEFGHPLSRRRDHVGRVAAGDHGQQLGVPLVPRRGDHLDAQVVA